MDKDELKNEVFNKLHHISIVVKDAEKAQKYYESIGIGPWADYPPLREYVKINVPDENGSGFTYLKTAADAGVVLLVRQSPPS